MSCILNSKGKSAPFFQCYSAKNPCLWFLLILQFGALQTSLLKHNRRLKQRDSLPLNALGELVDRKSPSVIPGQSFTTCHIIQRT